MAEEEEWRERLLINEVITGGKEEVSVLLKCQRDRGDIAIFLPCFFHSICTYTRIVYPTTGPCFWSLLSPAPFDRSATFYSTARPWSNLSVGIRDEASVTTRSSIQNFHFKYPYVVTISRSGYNKLNWLKRKIYRGNVHDFKFLRNPISRKKTASARIKFHVNFPRFFCGQGLLNFFIHAEVNKFPYIFAALRQENFSAHLSASDDGGSGLPLRRQFLSGEERILAAGVARKFLKRKKERKKDREIFPPFSLSRYLLLISSGIVDRKLINTYPRRNISSSTRLASSFFFPSPSFFFRITYALHFHASTWKFNVQVLPAE